MREITYKAYLIKQKEMVYVHNIDLEHKIIDYYGKNGDIYSAYYGTKKKTPADKCILLEFTGLKDKNGNKIFEGDVVEYEFDGTNLYSICGSTIKENIIQRVSEVKYQGTKYVLYNKNFGGYIDMDNINNSFIGDRSINLEIIGNIHENPELLREN